MSDPSKTSCPFYHLVFAVVRRSVSRHADMNASAQPSIVESYISGPPAVMNMAIRRSGHSIEEAYLRNRLWYLL